MCIDCEHYSRVVVLNKVVLICCTKQLLVLLSLVLLLLVSLLLVLLLLVLLSLSLLLNKSLQFGVPNLIHYILYPNLQPQPYIYIEIPLHIWKWISRSNSTQLRLILNYTVHLYILLFLRACIWICRKFFW